MLNLMHWLEGTNPSDQKLRFSSKDTLVPENAKSPLFTKNYKYCVQSLATNMTHFFRIGRGLNENFTFSGFNVSIGEVLLLIFFFF